MDTERFVSMEGWNVAGRWRVFLSGGAPGKALPGTPGLMKYKKKHWRR
jgi:hypothetical protein